MIASPPTTRRARTMGHTTVHMPRSDPAHTRDVRAPLSLATVPAGGAYRHRRRAYPEQARSECGASWRGARGAAYRCCTMPRGARTVLGPDRTFSRAHHHRWCHPAHACCRNGTTPALACTTNRVTCSRSAPSRHCRRAMPPCSPMPGASERHGSGKDARPITLAGGVEPRRPRDR